MHQETTLRGCCNEVGHLGLEQMPDQFFWPCMAAQAREDNTKCCQCITLKKKQPRTPMENTVAIHSLELVHLNYLSLEPGKGKEKNVLVVMDHFTCYVQVYVTLSQMALMTAKALWDNFIIHYGLSEKILLDQGRLLRVSS